MATKNPVNWFEIYVDDIARAKKFYEAVLQVEMMDMPAPDGSQEYQMAAFPMSESTENAGGALVHMPQMKAGGNSTVVYFQCEDCIVEQGRIEAAGGKVLQPKFSIGEYGFCAWGIDTEGNYFGLHSMQ